MGWVPLPVSSSTQWLVISFLILKSVSSLSFVHPPLPPPVFAGGPVVSPPHNVCSLLSYQEVVLLFQPHHSLSVSYMVVLSSHSCRHSLLVVSFGGLIFPFAPLPLSFMLGALVFAGLEPVSHLLQGLLLLHSLFQFRCNLLLHLGNLIL